MRTKTPLQADKILEAAGRLFGTQRFHEVRMEDIAAEAEVGKGTLYRYFSDKEELFLALVDRSADQLLCRVRSAVAEAEGPRGKLEAVVNGTVTFFDEHPHLFDIIQRAEVMNGPDFPWKKVRNEMIAQVTHFFEEGQRSGEFAGGDPEVAGLLLLGGLRGVIRFGRQPRPTDLTRRITSVFFQVPQQPDKQRRPARRTPFVAASEVPGHALR
jgi:AcrR family transcriptional regulator